MNQSHESVVSRHQHEISEYDARCCELTGDLTRAELCEALSSLRFRRGADLHRLVIDQDICAYLLAALERRPIIRIVERVSTGCPQDDPPPPKPSASEPLIEAVSHHFRISRKRLLGSGQTRSVASARQVLMVLLTQVAGMSASEAGRCVGRDHSTVLHAVNKFASAVVAINLSEGASPDVWVRTLAAAMEAR